MDITHVKDFIKSGSISSLCMGIFYPLEIAKLRIQANKTLKIPISHYYRGLTKSLLFVFPDKGIKFATFNYSQKYKNNFYTSIFYTSILQGLVSTPIEFYRFKKQFKKVNLINKNMYRGYQFIFCRDYIFNYIFFSKAYKKINFYDNLYGGLLATSISTPFDVIKTQYQQGFTSNKIITNIKKNPTILFKGIIPRTLSVGGFYGLTYFIYQNLK